MGSLRWVKLVLAWLTLSAHPTTHPDLTSGFYVPGVAPVEFLKNDRIDIRAIKITSVVTQLPYDFYSLPICAPAGDVYYRSENLGEVLRGDRIVNTAYEVLMAQDETCRLLCKNATSLTVDQTNRLINNIKEEYQVHLLADNLPSATRLEVPATGEQIYEHGHKLGFLNDKNEIFLNNHLNIKMFYHEHIENENKYRIVGFEVEPKSIGSDAYNLAEKDKCNEVPKEGHSLQKLQEGKETKIIWSYSVKWERSQIKWASRWDTYLAMKDVQIHWFSILNSIVVVICLSGFLSIIIIRAVRRDIAHYNRDDDYDETLEETGWKLVHGDVFRPPPNAKLLTSLTGTGIQIYAVSLTTLCFAMLGMLSPSSRGSLMTVALFLFCFFGLIAGYFAGRLYKTMRGVQWKRGAMQTGLLYPGIVAGTCLLLNFFIWGKHSSGAVPFSTMIALCAMWFGISLPLVMIGFYFGFRKQPYQHPVRTNQIPRQVPEQPWYLHSIPCMLLSGILPFGAMFIELFFIFTAIWEHEFYYMFGFLFIVFLILVVTVAQISIVVTYFQLCAENYHWWWKSYMVSGGSAFYVIVYSIFYYWTKLDIAGFVPSLLYFGYSFLIGVTFWLFSGTIGFYASYFFVCKIYGSVKID